MKYLIVLITSINLCFGFTPIKEGQPAPKDGYFVTPDEEFKVRNKLETLKFKNIKLEDLAFEQDKYIETLKTHNKELRSTVKDSQGFITKPMYFVLGGFTVSILTVGIIAMLKKAN